MTSDVFFGQLRALLAALGGFLVAQGWTDEGTVQLVVGALVTLGTAGWSAWAKFKAP